MTTRDAPRAEAASALLRVMVLAAALLPQAGFAQTDAEADPGNSQPCAGIPNCQLQQQAPVSYSADDTKGWAYYCSGDHPYYWGNAYAGNSGRWVQTNNCFTTTENGLGETGDPGKLDVTVTNWCLKKENYVISLACSTDPPPAWQENCAATPNPQYVTRDPNCPHVPNTDRRFSRTIGGVPIFLFTWVEQCSADLFWNCSADQGFIQCNSCAGR